MSVSLTKSLKPTSKAQLRKGAKLPLERKVFYDYFIFSDSKMANLESESIPKAVASHLVESPNLLSGKNPAI